MHPDDHPLAPWLRHPLLRIAVWSGAFALLGHRLGPVAWVVGAPLFAWGVARPLMALATGFRDFARARALRHVQGRHYAFKDRAIRVLEDADSGRWVCLADVHKVLGAGTSARMLELAFPGQVQAMDEPVEAYMRDEALVAHLGRHNAAVAPRLRTWVERTIVLPGQRVRGGRPGAAPPTC